MASCLRRTRTALAVIKAVISRSLFALHGFICIWRVTVVKEKPLYWCLSGTLPLMVLEAVVTIRLKRGGEWKWLCPSVLLYIGTAVPAIWFLELDLMEARMTSLSAHDVLMTQRNASDDDAISGVLRGKLRIRISLGREEWCKILEQMLLLILIIGRWLLPKGEISREQLSQLLLVYIGMAADIIELFEAFKEDGVRENSLLTLIILSLWTASLMQFTFVLTATKSKRMRPVLFNSGSNASAISVGGKSCCPTEVVSIVISMVLQDGPFLVLRLLLIFRYDVLSYTNLFFTSKNSLVLVLQLYRLVVLFSHTKDAAPDEETASGDRPQQQQQRHHHHHQHHHQHHQSTPGASGAKGGHSGATSGRGASGPRRKASGAAPPPPSSSSHSTPPSARNNTNSGSKPSRHHRAPPGGGAVTSGDDVVVVVTRGADPAGGGRRRQQQGGDAAPPAAGHAAGTSSARRRESFQRQRRTKALENLEVPATIPLPPSPIPIPSRSPSPSASSVVSPSPSLSGSSLSLAAARSAAASPSPDLRAYSKHHDKTERRGRTSAAHQRPGPATNAVAALWPPPLLHDASPVRGRRGAGGADDADGGEREWRGGDRDVANHEGRVRGHDRGEGKAGGQRRLDPHGPQRGQGSQGQPKAVAVVNESGRYRALVLRPVETADRQTVYVVESQHDNGIQCV